MCVLEMEATRTGEESVEKRTKIIYHHALVGLFVASGASSPWIGVQTWWMALNGLSGLAQSTHRNTTLAQSSRTMRKAAQSASVRHRLSYNLTFASVSAR